MSRINNLIRDYFGFSSTELRGFWVLLTFALIFVSTTFFTKKFFEPAAQTSSINQDSKRIDSLIALLTVIEPSTKKEKKVNYTHFDPNTASENLLTQNGFPQWLAKRLIKYRSKGGKFRKKEDLKKIYGFSDDLYAEVESFVILPKNVYTSQNQVKILRSAYSAPKPNVSKRRKMRLEPTDINLADSTQLQKLAGIGPVLSSRIIRFRDRLGGIYSVDQFNEVYQISDEAVLNLRKYTYISSDIEVATLSINDENVSTLAKHPYISFSLAKAIVKHRDNYGKFEKVKDINEVYLMNDSIFQRVEPYLGL